MDRKKTCNCLSDCPCYPDCDRMMSEGRIAGISPQDRRFRDADWMMERQGGGEDWTGYMRQAPKTAQEGKSPADAKARADGGMTAEEENERDWQKLKEMYPEMAKIILAEVENVCDSMEYEGSMMFDSMPDKVRIRKMTEAIYEKVKDRYPVEEAPDRDDMFAMNQEGRRRYPPKQNWLSDFIQVLLYQEMFQRRCRHRGCRRW